jgi:hypothetical protein
MDRVDGVADLEHHRARPNLDRSSRVANDVDLGETDHVRPPPASG